MNMIRRIFTQPNGKIFWPAVAIAALTLLIVIGIGAAFVIDDAHAGEVTAEETGEWSAGTPGKMLQGISITAWPDHPNRNAGMTFLWFTYSPWDSVDDPDFTGARQTWLRADTYHNVGNDKSCVDLFLTDGRFIGRDTSMSDPVGSACLDVSEDGSQIVMGYAISAWPATCADSVLPSPVPPYCTGSIAMTRLTPKVQVFPD